MEVLTATTWPINPECRMPIDVLIRRNRWACALHEVIARNRLRLAVGSSVRKDKGEELRARNIIALNDRGVARS